MKLSWTRGGRWTRWAVGTAVNVTLASALAGRLDLPWVWATLALGSLFSLGFFLRIDPELLRERGRPGPGGFDRRTRRLLVALLALQSVVACVDVGRFHWSDTVPPGVHVLALVLAAAGLTLMAWAITVNPYFSSVIRIQDDRGHTVVTTGPYRLVRHPGYLGMALAYPMIGLALGSWWALVPGVGCVLVVVRRVVLEDRYLVERLAGYGAYSERVGYRLIPQVW